MWNGGFLSSQPKYPQLSSQLIKKSDAMTARAPPYNTHTHTLQPIYIVHAIVLHYLICNTTFNLRKLTWTHHSPLQEPILKSSEHM